MFEDYGILMCSFKNDLTAMVVLRLKKLYDNAYIRVPREQTGIVDYQALWQWKGRQLRFS